VVGLIGIVVVAGFAQTAKKPESHDAAELARLYEQDQADRAPLDNGVPSQDVLMKLVRNDELRRHRVREMIDADLLATGRDYYRAAMIFQHGMEPDDFLLGHLLAMQGVARGSVDSRWVASATLDRYLQSIQQPQVFGTQFKAQEKTPFTQEPFNRKLLPEKLRTAFCVPSLQQQEETLAALNRHESPEPPAVCP
jgi:hypothetical protein